MAVENFIYAIPQELVGKFQWLLVVLQAVGWAVLIYIIFNIVNAVLNRKRNSAVEQINLNLVEIKELLKQNLNKKN